MNSISQPFRSAHDPCGWPKPQRPKTDHASFASSNEDPRHANTSHRDSAVLLMLRPGLARSNVEAPLKGSEGSSRPREEAETRREFALKIRLVTSAPTKIGR